MVTSLKDVMIVDGSGWLPFLGDVVMDGGKVSKVASGTCTLYVEEPSFDEIKKFDTYDYLVPGFDAPMTKEKYEAELKKIADAVSAGQKIEKAVRSMTGYGVGQREYLKDGVAANVMVVDKDLKTIKAAYADGKSVL